MTLGRWKRAALAAMIASIVGVTGLQPSFGQTAPRGITLYEDVKTGALYRNPAKGRVAVTLGFDEPAAPAPAAVQQQLEREVKKNNEELRAEFIANQQTLIRENTDLRARVDKIEPAWADYLNNFRNKFRVGALLYADYAMYTHTGFGPQFLESQTYPGPGNNIYNSFDITRAYLNFYFNPTPDWQLRITPDIYKSFGTASTSAVSRTSSVGSNLSGDLNYRIKYAYLEYNKILDWVGDATRGSTVSIGDLPNVFIPWTEDLFGFRYVSYGPWNFVGLSSGQFGMKVEGPLKYHELTYVDYSVGAFSNAKYNQFEQTNTKQAMARVSIYPFGARWRFQGLGATAFYDYGYNNSAPDNASVNTGFGPNPTAFGHVNNAHLTRFAAMLHYDADEWMVAGEWDYGHNAFPGTSLFSSNGPAVFFTPPTFTVSGKTASAAANPYSVPYYNFSAMTAALQNNSRTVQQGFDFFGRLHIPDTRFSLFGMFQMFQPNTKVNLNPLDFQRWVAGVQYQVNEFVRIALDTQNLQYYHDQFPSSTAYANTFGDVFLAVTNSGKTGPKTFKPPATINQPVPRDTHIVELNLEFNF